MGAPLVGFFDLFGRTIYFILMLITGTVPYRTVPLPYSIVIFANIQDGVHIVWIVYNRTVINPKP